MTRDRPLLLQRPGLLSKLDTCKVDRTVFETKSFHYEIRRSLAEFQKCAARFDDPDSASMTLAVLGISLIAQELLLLCRQYQDALPEAVQKDP
jgi:hypothetical protein